MEQNTLKQNLLNPETWLRGLFMLIFAIIYFVARIVVAGVAIFQWVACLFTGDPNARVLRFGQQLSTYVYQILMFLTFNTEQWPWPLSPWPAGAPPARAGGNASSRTAAGSKTTSKKTASKKKAAAKKKAESKPAEPTGDEEPTAGG